MGVKKRSFLILEFCIAMVLMGGIVSILFFLFREMALAKVPLQKEREDIFRLERVRLRMGQILSSLSSWKKGQQGDYLFMCNNLLDIDPAFRGELKGVVYVNKGDLCVKIFPNKNFAKNTPRLEVLSEGVVEFSIQFFDRAEGKWTESYPKMKIFMVKGFINKMEIPFFL